MNDELPRAVWTPQPNMLQEISGETTPLMKNEETEPRQKKHTQLWMWLVMEVKSNAVKNSAA